MGRQRDSQGLIKKDALYDQDVLISTVGKCAISFGGGSLPVKHHKIKTYAVGDISYWPPLGSLVILYGQNGEVFEQVSIGHIEDDIRFFSGMPEATILFETVKES